MNAKPATLPPMKGERMGKPDFLNVDFNQSPFIVIWEVTRACDLACVHCRAEAQPLRNHMELSAKEAFRLLDQIREFGKPLFVITGGDPLKRPDIFDITRYADGLGLRVALTPSGTSWLNQDAVQKIKDNGVSRLAVSLDGSTAAIHDAFRQVDGSYDWTLSAIRMARKIDLPVQINTTVSRKNENDTLAVARLLEGEDICLWSVFFMVPTGRGQKGLIVSPARHEEIFHLLYDLSKTMPYDIKTTSAQHYRRVVMQRAVEEAAAGSGEGGRPVFLTGKATPGFDASQGIGRAAKGVNDGNGFVFISHTGEVYPSGFLPVSGGNVRRRSLVDIYRESPLFKRIRDYTQLKGKCGYCDFKEVCGGSRARAFGVTGDVMGTEPYCVYQPPKPPELAERIRSRSVQDK